MSGAHAGLNADQHVKSTCPLCSLSCPLCSFHDLTGVPSQVRTEPLLDLQQWVASSVAVKILQNDGPATFNGKEGAPLIVRPALNFSHTRLPSAGHAQAHPLNPKP